MKALPIWIAALLYGFLHPGAKLLLDGGLEMLALCLLNIGIRLLVDLPIVLATGSLRIQTRKLFGTLLILVLVGTAFQLCEFSSISQGLPVPLIIFIVYSHPIWTLLVSRFLNKEKRSSSAVFNLVFAIAGVVLIAGFHLIDAATHWSLLLGPLLGSVLISFWICLANLARKQDCRPQTISFYYNLFSFVTLLSISFVKDGGHALQSAEQFIRVTPNLISILVYALLLGSLPNYLFYYGSKAVPAFRAGLILLLEPLVSTGVSYWIWQDALSFGFFAGATCILITNLPPMKLSIRGLSRDGLVQRFRAFLNSVPEVARYAVPIFIVASLGLITLIIKTPKVLAKMRPKSSQNLESEKEPLLEINPM